jgi:hypothetical protein
MSDEVVKPYPVAAVFCEKVLLERDNVVTPVRVIDRVYLNRDSYEASTQDANAFVQIAFLLKYISVNYSGKHTLSISVLNPAGKESNLIEPAPIVFAANRIGIQVRIEVNIRVKDLGRYWAVVRLDDEVSVRTPLELTLPEEESEQKQ